LPLTPTATTETYTLSLHDALPIFNAGPWSLIHNWHCSCQDSSQQPADPFGEWHRPFLGLAQIRCSLGNNFGVLWISSDIKQLLRSEEHTSELQSRENLVCRLLLEK